MVYNYSMCKQSSENAVTYVGLLEKLVKSRYEVFPEKFHDEIILTFLTW